jgi:hypothetical protein
MRLRHLVETYVTFERALGLRLCSEASTLRAFCRAMGDIEVADVQPAAVLAFIAGNGPVTAAWKQKASVLRSFYRYAIGRGFAATSSDVDFQDVHHLRRPFQFHFGPERLERLRRGGVHDARARLCSVRVRAFGRRRNQRLEQWRPDNSTVI